MKWLMAIMASLFLSTPWMTAQTDHDSKGTEFWVTFLEGFGSNGDPPDLRLYLASEKPATAYVEYLVTGEVIEVPLLIPRLSVELDISATFGTSSELSRWDVGVSNKVFRVTATEEITLYGVNNRLASSDAYLAFPEDALTREYRLLSYPNGWVSGFPGSSGSWDHPSQFGVVAVEDGTVLNIRTGARIRGEGGPVYSIGLDRGQVYFAQAETGSRQDVTGTHIASNKPVAVFSGVRRSSIPTDVGNYRDHLIEQIPPSQTWGYRAIFTPFRIVELGVPYNSIARVVAAEDNTAWTLDGQAQPPLSEGEVVELSLLERPMVVESDKPILAAQYEHSVGYGTADTLGDPFMAIIAPPEQYDTSYSFQSIPHPDFRRHFANLVVHKDAVASLRLDGVPISDRFFDIPSTEFVFSQIALQAGAHHIRCDEPFGLLLYGYGWANSYGYLGGTLFRDLMIDFHRPEPWIRGGSCDSLWGSVTDIRDDDLGIDSLYQIPAGNSNVTFYPGPFDAPADSVNWSARLVDPLQDGRFIYRAVDKGGRSTYDTISVPGFTVSATGSPSPSPKRIRVPVYNGGSACFDLPLLNYGGFTQELVDPVIANLAALQPVEIDLVGPRSIERADTGWIRLCVDGALDSMAVAELLIGDSCVSRLAYLIEIVFIPDTLSPELTMSSDCRDERRIVFREPNREFFGVRSLSLEAVENLSVDFSDTTNLPATSVSATFRLQDPYQDGFARYTAVDMAGNRVTITDTISGFTLAVEEPETFKRLAVRLDSPYESATLQVGEKRCDTVMLINYGVRELRLEGVVAQTNEWASVPPAQFPRTLGPGDTASVACCLEGMHRGEQTDTLLLLDECGRIEKVAVISPVDYLFGEGADECGQQLSLQVYSAAKRTFLDTPLPNPAEGRLTVALGVREDTRVTIELLPLEGSDGLRPLDSAPIRAGVHRLSFDVSDLASGAYWCRMTTSDGEVEGQKVMILR